MPQLPAQIYVSESGSFAEHTINKRLPDILQDALADNDYPSQIVAAIGLLDRELFNGTVQPFVDNGPDASFWLASWETWREHTWHQLPWFWAETYFYRRLLNAVRYFEPDAWYQQDPFARSKRSACASGIKRLRAVLEEAGRVGTATELVNYWLLQSLWANQADLSNQSSLSQADASAADKVDAILADERSQIGGSLLHKRIARLDIVCDNAGPELVIDLALIDMLFAAQLVDRVVLHLKGQPYYVSDAMPQDVRAAVDALLATPVAVLAELGMRIERSLEDGRLVLQAHPFWTTYHTLFDMPRDLLHDLAESDLILFKGDVNYRRLLDDRHWPFTFPLRDIPNQVPAQYAVLRTVKSELICGLMPGQPKKIAQHDPEWLTNGRWGVIQHVPPR